jgi:RNA recognition motif-containing protein
MLGIVTDRSTRVFIRNIPLSLIERFDKDALRAELEAAGPIVRYTMFVDKARRFTGQAMCTFETPAAAAAAVEALNGRVLEGEVEPIEVEMAASHGVVLAETLKEERHLERLHTEQWKHDRYGKEFFSRGASRGRGAGRGRAGGFGQSNPGADLTGII